MLQERVADLSRRLSEYVEPDRVRREVYTDPADLRRSRCSASTRRVWIYCGHESQVPKAGDYYTVQIGRQPMVMVRGADGKVNVLYNRCPHRGNMMVRRPPRQHRRVLPLLLPRLDLPPRRQAAKHPDDGVGLRRHAL